MRIGLFVRPEREAEFARYLQGRFVPLLRGSSHQDPWGDVQIVDMGVPIYEIVLCMLKAGAGLPTILFDEFRSWPRSLFGSRGEILFSTSNSREGPRAVTAISDLVELPKALDALDRCFPELRSKEQILETWPEARHFPGDPPPIGKRFRSRSGSESLPSPEVFEICGWVKYRAQPTYGWWLGAPVDLTVRAQYNLTFSEDSGLCLYPPSLVSVDEKDHAGSAQSKMQPLGAE